MPKRLDELIADDLDGYIDLAVRLGGDQALRHHVCTQIADRLPMVFGDLGPVRAFEQFFWQAVRRH